MKNYTGRDLGQDFKDFYKSEKKKITAALKKLGAVDIQMSMQFYYFYGMYTIGEQTWYFSCSDVRHFDYEIMYRKTNSYKDCTGGSNNYTKNYEFK